MTKAIDERERGEVRRYVCNRYPSYSIRKLYFERGLYETDVIEEQELIESTDGFNVYIFLQDEPAAKPPRAAAKEDRQPSRPKDRMATSVAGGISRGGIDSGSQDARAGDVKTV